MENLILIAVGIAILYQSIKLINEQRKLKDRMNKLNEDFNIEYGATEGTGIHVVKKQYPNLEVKDNFREKVSEPTPHSISNSMNDSSSMQKKAFDENEK